MREITFAQSLLEATDQLLAIDPSVYVMGLGVPDPKGIFGTTVGLAEKYGPQRVMDMPVSENAMTGIAIGSAIVGMRPILTHQRVDFALLSLDQLINNAAKWHYMFGGKMKVPLVVRLIIGRGWGQGPQHSQTLHSLFAHIPGLKVVMPSTPYDAKGLLVAAVEDDNPVLYLEHRWLHGTFGAVPEALYKVPLGKAKVVKEGADLTVIASSHMTVEAWRAIHILEAEDLSIELIDVRTIKPLDTETLLDSARKTKRVLILDPDWKTCGFGAELMAMIAENVWDELYLPPKRLTFPDRFSPTTWPLANHYYPTPHDIAAHILEMMERPIHARTLLESWIEMKIKTPFDTPDQSFRGPF